MSASEVRNDAPLTPTIRSRPLAGATVCLFLCALLTPAIDTLLRPDEERSVTRENRNPAEFPDPIESLTLLSKFPAGFERWFADRLGARDALLRASHLESALLLGLSPSPTITRGSDGFDFFAGDDSERVHRGVRPATARELERLLRSFEAQRDRCRRLGAEYVFVIAPNKETIYAEKWPKNRAPVGPTRLEQFAAFVKSRSDLRFVDLREPLMRERENDRPAVGDFVYHPLGSHFTWRGAFAAWNAVVAACADLEPALRPLDWNDFSVRELKENENDSMWDQTYVGEFFHQRGYTLDRIRGVEPVIEYGPKNELLASRMDDPSLPNVLFVHDSFGPWMLPFVTRSAARVNSVWTHHLPRELVERYRPHLVIQEVTERALTWGFGEVAPDVEHVSRAVFSSFQPLFGPVDLASASPFATRGGVSITPADNTWSIEQRAGDGLITLPDALLADGRDLGLHMRIDAPSEGNMLVYYQTKPEPRFARLRVLAVNLSAGANDLVLRTRAPGLFGGLQIRLSAAGVYTLRAFEMRSAR